MLGLGKVSDSFKKHDFVWEEAVAEKRNTFTHNEKE